MSSSVQTCGDQQYHIPPILGPVSRPVTSSLILKIIPIYTKNIYRDDHQFSPLHWAAKGGHLKILELLLGRGARVHTTNMGDDTPLHLGAAHGHREVVQTVGRKYFQTDEIFFKPITLQLLRQKADVNFVNEHGNTPLHYACFWGYTDIAEELIDAGALVTIQNKYQETPLDKCGGRAAERLGARASQAGQDMRVRD